MATRQTQVDHATHPAQLVPGLAAFMRDSRKLGKEFEKALRIANIQVASSVVKKAQQRASTPAERAVAKGLVAKPDKIPRIEVDRRRPFVSSSRPNAKRKAAGKARIIDVWFGVEFGGGKYRDAGSDTNRVAHKGRLVRRGGGYTTQFRPHLGTEGYFFYPTVRAEGKNTEAQYARTIEEVRKKWQRGAL
ncbi:MAG TPA: hypothetical protein VIG24_18875 [Acidimicrobiia bacterium]